MAKSLFESFKLTQPEFDFHEYKSSEKEFSRLLVEFVENVQNLNSKEDTMTAALKSFLEVDDLICKNFIIRVCHLQIGVQT